MSLLYVHFYNLWGIFVNICEADRDRCTDVLVAVTVNKCYQI